MSRIATVVIEMDLLLSRRLRLSNSCPLPQCRSDGRHLGGGAYTCVCGMCVVYVRLIYYDMGGVGVVVSPQGGDRCQWEIALGPGPMIHFWALPRSCRSYGVALFY